MVIVKDQSSHLVYLNICIKLQTFNKFELNWSSKLQNMNETKKTLSHEVVCFQMLDFETSNSKLEVLKSNSWKITSFSKTTSLQREPFLTMCYTINLSPLLVTKWGFMLIIILSNYQKCPLLFPPTFVSWSILTSWAFSVCFLTRCLSVFLRMYFHFTAYMYIFMFVVVLSFSVREILS